MAKAAKKKPARKKRMRTELLVLAALGERAAEHAQAFPKVDTFTEIEAVPPVLFNDLIELSCACMHDAYPAALNSLGRLVLHASELLVLLQKEMSDGVEQEPLDSSAML